MKQEIFQWYSGDRLQWALKDFLEDLMKRGYWIDATTGTNYSTYVTIVAHKQEPYAEAV